MFGRKYLVCPGFSWVRERWRFICQEARCGILGVERLAIKVAKRLKLSVLWAQCLSSLGTEGSWHTFHSVLNATLISSRNFVIVGQSTYLIISSSS